MKWFTHIGFSTLIFLIIKKLLEINNTLIIILGLSFCIIGGVIADIDIHFKIFSKHRGLIHSIIGLTIMSIPLLIIFSVLNLGIISLFFIAGYFFHLFLDSYTVYGVKWFPLLPRSKGFIKTGGLFENILAIIIWSIVIIFIFI